MERRHQLTGVHRNEIAAGQGWRCGVCEELLPAAFECDHLVPFCLTRSHARAWLWCLCNNCHGRKSLLERRETGAVKRKLQALADAGAEDLAYCHACRDTFSPRFAHRCAVTPETVRAAWRARLLGSAREAEAAACALELEADAAGRAARAAAVQPFVESFRAGSGLERFRFVARAAADERGSGPKNIPPAGGEQRPDNVSDVSLA